jgi:porphobilinogen synthase
MGHNFPHASVQPHSFSPESSAPPAPRCFTRNLRESVLTPHDFIYPVFVHEGQNKREAVPSMPGVDRLSLDLLLPVAEECVKLEIPYLALFPAIESSLKTPDGEALNPDGRSRAWCAH